MRKQLFDRGFLTRDAFDAEARQKAIQSQQREGLQNPYGEEAADVWGERLRIVRDHMTDFYFANNLPYEEFEKIVRLAISEQGETPDLITFNPELAPQDMVFQQAEEIERMPAAKRKAFEARLQEIKSVLIRSMISDQLAYLNIARRWFTVADLKGIYQRKVGYGKIGGKAAGMMLAYRILKDAAPPDVREAVRIPVSYFLASDLYYVFIANNGLVHWGDQKYKPEAQMRSDYPHIVRDFVNGIFPDDILERLRDILVEAAKRPLIVRSSSLLEDNFGNSFAGKYNSYFCPNQGTPEENLKSLTEAIARVYASCVNPNALLYRHSKGLVEYDERIAVLLQFVEGEQFGNYFMPHAAGVAFSRNLYRWSPQIRKEDGFLRLVWGLGTPRSGIFRRRAPAPSGSQSSAVTAGRFNRRDPPALPAIRGFDRSRKERLANFPGPGSTFGPIPALALRCAGGSGWLPEFFEKQHGGRQPPGCLLRWLAAPDFLCQTDEGLADHA